MNTQKNTEAFKEFCMMEPFAAKRVDYWYDGEDFYDVIVVMKDGSAYLYDSFESSSRYAESVDELFKSPENEDEWRRKFSYNLYQVMRRRGYSQVALAEASGLSQMSISNYTSGVSTPTVYKLMKIADALGCTVNDLVYF